MIPAVDHVTFTQHPSTLEQWLFICLIIGVAVVIGSIVRGALVLLWFLGVVGRELWRAHRRGIARVRAYEVKMRA